MSTWRDAARRAFDRAGETITLRRLGSPNVDIPNVRAKARGYVPEELVGGIAQTDREIRILAEDVTFDPPLRRGDKVLMHGRMLNIESVDASRARVGDEVIQYIVRATG